MFIDKFTNLTNQVFALTNLPEVIKGALFSRYSRSSKPLRELYAQEFSSVDGEESADALYARMLLGYGDDSVAELGSAHIALEDISFLAAKALEDNRLGVSPLEKSTRYVSYAETNAQGQYKYVSIGGSVELTNLYHQTMQGVFQTYADLLPKVLEEVRARTPKAPETTTRAYNSATKAKALDLLRGLLPMATQTNLGLHGNGRGFEYLLTKLYATELPEVLELAQAMQVELEQVIKPFVQRAATPRGQAYTQYIRTKLEAVDTLVQGSNGYYDWRSNRSSPSCAGVQLVDYYPCGVAALKALNQWILVDTKQADSLGAAAHLLNCLEMDKYKLLQAYANTRATRHHKVGRALEAIDFTFQITLDVGAWRDLQRHRQLLQAVGYLKFPQGASWYTPADLPDWALKPYQEALSSLQDLYDEVEFRLGPALAQYCVPCAAYTTWDIKLNLREAVHLCELRSGIEGHPTYRWVAQQIYKAIADELPGIAQICFQHVNLEPSVELQRLGSEQKLDRKLEQLNEPA